MQHTDDATLNYYREHAREIFERYEAIEQSSIAAHFLSSFEPSSRVLDVGAGSGRDLRKLLELGFDAYGAEPADELRQLAIDAHPILKDRLFAGSLPGGLTTYRKYDAVVCSAVLMHIPPNQLFDAILALRDALNEQGRLLISIPASRPDIDENHRDDNGRLFSPVTPDQLKLLCSNNSQELSMILVPLHTAQPATILINSE